MDSKINFTREGFHTVTSYLLVEDVNLLIQFIEKAFDGIKLVLLNRNDGSIMHAEMKIGDSMVMMGEANEEFGPVCGSLYLYVINCDLTYDRAIKSGATSIMPPTTMYHAGERYGGIKDPCGNIWWIATHIEDVTAEEEAKRIKEMD